MTAKLPLIIDTDPGVDDALALAWLLTQPAYSVDILGIGVAAGNTGVQHAAHSAYTLWCLVAPDEEAPWRQVLQNNFQSRQEAILALYSEPIPPITMFLSTGKLMFNLNLLPPLLVGNVQCYWRQQPGHSLTELEWRTILYDYAYTRATWREDKEGRAEQALVHNAIWQKAPTLGLGVKVGPFWYPNPISPLENVYD